MRLMIIGSMGGQLGLATKIAKNKGAKVVHALNIDEALRSLRSGLGADLIFADLELDIFGLCNALNDEHFFLPVVACGLDNNARSAVNAIRAGAKEYIPLPPDPELIAAVLAAVSEERQSLIFADPSMEKVVTLAQQVAKSEASLLITGESGTGKEVMANFIHANSKRADRPMISINCAAIPEALLESELFGHEKGAFTGAVAQRIGKFEEASGGTLLLDEISEMDIHLQAKLLRALQERVIDRIGGKRPISIDIRVIATSNRHLPEAVKKGQFREDLYYRLNVVNLCLPPLRERPRDILKLADHFVRKYCEINGTAPKSLSEDAHRQLAAQNWPGNVRELENAVHRAVLLSPDDIIGSEAVVQPDGGSIYGAAQTPSAGDSRVSSASAAAADAIQDSMIGQTVADVERDLILGTLGHCLGNRTHAATILGISIRTLRNKLKLYNEEGIAVPPPGSEPQNLDQRGPLGSY